MTRRIVLILTGFGCWATSALGQAPATAPGTAAEPAAELKALADSCSAHKFETMVVVDGSGQAKKVKICGKEGQTDAQWLATLRDSARKVAADAAMAKPIKDQIIAALKVEIARLEGTAAAASAPPVPTVAFPAAPVSVPEAAPQYSSVPPLPAPLPRAGSSLARSTAASVPRPRLTLRCALPRENFAACSRLERETRLLIRADEDIPAGTSLRFLRGGDALADLDLGALKKGKGLHEKLPGRLCVGAFRGKIQVQVLNNNRVAETLGPWPLLCGY